MDKRQIAIYLQHLRNKSRIDTIYAKGKFNGKDMVFTNMGWMSETQHSHLNNNKTTALC